MKVKNSLLLIILLLLPIVVSAQDVGIKSVELVNKSEFVEVIKDPTYEGLNINFDIKFYTVGDNATYKLELENKDSDNYFINLKTDSDSKYVLYTIDSDLDTNIIKSNSSTIIYIIVKYANEVPSYKLTNNKYSETNNVKISLTNNKGEEVITDTTTKNAAIVVNPNTGNIVLRIRNSNIVISLYTVGIVLLIAIIAIVVLKKLKIKKYLGMMLILGLILIPGMVTALKEVTLTINSKIEIEPKALKTFKVRKFNEEANKFDKEINYIYEEGMTIEEWLESKFNKDNFYFTAKEDITVPTNHQCKNFSAIVPVDLYHLPVPLDSQMIYEMFTDPPKVQNTIRAMADERDSIMNYELNDNTLVAYVEFEYCDPGR